MENIRFENHNWPNTSTCYADIVRNGKFIGWSVMMYGGADIIEFEKKEGKKTVTEKLAMPKETAPIIETFRISAPEEYKSFADRWDDSESMEGEDIILIFEGLNGLERLINFYDNVLKR